MNKNDEKNKREYHKFKLFCFSRGYILESEQDGVMIMKNEKVKNVKMVFDPHSNNERYTLRFINKIVNKGSSLENFRANML